MSTNRDALTTAREPSHWALDTLSDDTVYHLSLACDMSRNCSWFERGLIEPWSNINNTGANDTMERPPSQLENVRPTGIKPPSRLPAMGPTHHARMLLETSQSELNARSAMPPPPGTMGKHKISGRMCISVKTAIHV